MNISTLMVAFDVGTVFAAVVPTVLFITLIIFKTGGLSPVIVRTKQPLKVAGVSTMTSNNSFVKDDALLWKEFRKVKEDNLIFKKKGSAFSYALIKMTQKEAPWGHEKNTDDSQWRYLIGDIVQDFNNIQKGFEPEEFKNGTFVMVKRSFKREVPWVTETLKIEKFLYKKWLPKSKYEVNDKSIIKSVELHNKRKESKKRTIIFYVAVRKKAQLDSTNENDTH